MAKRMMTSAILCLALYLPHALSFTSPATRTFVGLETGTGFGSKHNFASTTSSFSTTLSRRNEKLSWMTKLQMSEEDGATAPRKRRRRKDGKNAASVEKEGEGSVEAASSSTETSENKPVPEAETESVAAVVASTPSPPPPSKSADVKAMDIRDIVAGKTSSTETSATKVEEKAENQEDYDDDDDDELEDDEEYEYYYTDENNNEVIVGTSSSGDNSLESLLADARRMRESDAASSSAEEEEQGSSIKSTVKNVISTIVTADFFVVCALLAWFLAGIFCSYVIKDDTVQIAFNGIFEPVVQPALGILMIGSAAGAAFSEEKEE